MTNFHNRPLAQKARGAIMRLDSVGNKMQLTARPSHDDAGQPDRVSRTSGVDSLLGNLVRTSQVDMAQLKNCTPDTTAWL